MLESKMDTERIEPSARPAGQDTEWANVVQLAQATVRLDGRTIWQDATASVRAGEFVTVLGPNGAGKSTLLRLLLGLIRPSAGEVDVLGEPPRRGNPAIGYVPQRRTLESDLAVSGRDLVALGLDGHRWGFGLPGPARREQRALVQEALAAVGATDYADRPIGRLSGGEQQRLLLAQALTGKPRLLLLDEPLASLDLRNQVAVAQLVARLARAESITVLLVAHDVNPLLPVLDRVLYVARGRVAIGTPAEIITTERLSALYDAPVEVVRDSRGRMFVVGLDGETAHPHGSERAG
ncbi:MAG: metal ABC transporter ATP-binding protein [Ktedonobacterales bacterium]